jgi:hypothetical protein
LAAYFIHDLSKSFLSEEEGTTETQILLPHDDVDRILGNVTGKTRPLSRVGVDLGRGGAVLMFRAADAPPARAGMKLAVEVSPHRFESDPRRGH